MSIYCEMKESNLSDFITLGALLGVMLGGRLGYMLLYNFEEFVQRGTVSPEKLRMGTDWGTNEFGFFDPNKNAIFIMEDI